MTPLVELFYLICKREQTPPSVMITVEAILYDDALNAAMLLKASTQPHQ